MVSGPDLGAGFLWQLSVDEGGPEEPGFTYHLQDGGEDAAGPPIGPPDFLGYRHPEAACMFGGPRCWERRFLAEPAALVRVRTAYQRTRLAFAALLGHQYEDRPVPFAEEFERLLGLCDAPLRAAGLPYRIDARTAAWIAGDGPSPARLRLEVGPGGTDRLGELLERELIEPIASRGPEEGFGGRAFLGTVKAGLLVDFGERPPGAGTGPGAVREVAWRGFGVPIAASGRSSGGSRPPLEP